MNKASNVKDNCLEILGEATLQKYAKPSDPRKYFNLKRVPLFCRKLQFPECIQTRPGVWSPALPQGIMEGVDSLRERAFHLPRAGESWRPPPR